MAGPARKRQRVSVADILNTNSDSLATIPVEMPAPRKASKSARRTVRELREIVRRYSKGPISYTALTEQIIVPISLLDLF
jgi:hypothetical protein